MIYLRLRGKLGRVRWRKSLESKWAISNAPYFSKVLGDETLTDGGNVVCFAGLKGRLSAQTNPADQDGVAANRDGELDELVGGVHLVVADFDGDNLVGGRDLRDGDTRGEVLVGSTGGFGFAEFGVHRSRRANGADLQDEHEAAVFGNVNVGHW